MVKEYVTLAAVYHKLDHVKVAVLKDLGRVRTENGWESFSRGDEAIIPYWLALTLEMRGEVEIREQKLTPADIGKYLMIERGLRGHSFHQLKGRFYLEANALINNLKEKSKESPDAYLRAVKTQGNLEDLVRIRLRKILNAAFLSSKPEEVLDKILPEERPLFIELTTLIRSWFREVIKTD